MSKKDKKKAPAEEPIKQEPVVEPATDEQLAAEEPQQPTAEERIAALEQQLEKEKNQYLFLMADFDNFRKRTRQEKMDLLKNGAEGAMRDL